jgi:hypothetical protein
MSFAPFTGTLIVPTDLAVVYTAPRGELLAATVWTEEFWTLKNSLAYAQVQGDKTEINVDQTTTAIAVKYGVGTTTCTFQIPDMSNTAITQFFTSVALENPAEVIDPDTTSYGFSSSLLTVTSKMVMLKYTNDWSIIFPHCEMVGVLTKTGDASWTIDITLTVLAGDSGGEAADFVILKPD